MTVTDQLRQLGEQEPYEWERLGPKDEPDDFMLVRRDVWGPMLAVIDAAERFRPSGSSPLESKVALHRALAALARAVEEHTKP